jgi:hypothetical protein
LKHQYEAKIGPERDFPIVGLARTGPMENSLLMGFCLPEHVIATLANSNLAGDMFSKDPEMLLL